MREVSLAILLASAATSALAASTPVPDRRVLPLAELPFEGRVAPAAAAALPAFPARIAAPAGAPNVLLVMTDDVGFGAASTFGGPIPTPNLDRLAARSLVYNRFHTTALCSPSRAALLTGRNHHAVASGVVTDMATGFPGYTSAIPKSAATIARVLGENGYSTAMFGKHHNVPMWETAPAAGQLDHWPTGLGFDYFYGFIGGETDQWRPALVRNTSRVDAPDSGRPDSILDRFLADDALRWLHEQQASAPERPFFIYYAPGSAHAPLQAPRAWIDRFAGRFDEGWDSARAGAVARQKAMGLTPPDAEITARPQQIPAWTSLTPDQRRFAARMMEVYAGMLAYQDAQIGRILDELERMGVADDTLVIFIQGDNGASAEGGRLGSTNWVTALLGGGETDAWRASQLEAAGGPESYGHFPAGWAWALNAPFPWFKTLASHLGGTRDPMVVSWPARIKRPGVRTQFHDLVDVMPTILEAAGVPAPTSVDGVRQQPVDGVSFAYSWDAPDAPGRRRVKYFEMFGSRAVYRDGWWAGTTPQFVPGADPATVPPVGEWPWELYHLDRDFAQARNLAAAEPARLKAMQALFDSEARRNNVYPLQTVTPDRLRNHPYGRERKEFVFWGPGVRLSDDIAPPLRKRSFAIEADVDIPSGGGDGVLAASGGQFGGWAFYLRNGKPTAVYAGSRRADDRFQVQATRALAPGRATLTFAFTYRGDRNYTGEGDLSIKVDGREIGRGRIGRIVPTQAEPTETFDIGDDSGSQVSADYAGASKFDGAIRKVTVRIAPSSDTSNEQRTSSGGM